MAGFITKQPNGLLCRFSSVVDCPTHWNMTEEDYIEYCAERAREEARFVLQHKLRPFEWLFEHFAPHNMTVEEFKKVVKDMDYEGEIPVKERWSEDAE